MFLPTRVAVFQGPNTRLLMYDKLQWAGHLIFQTPFASQMKKDILKSRKEYLETNKHLYPLTDSTLKSCLEFPYTA